MTAIWPAGPPNVCQEMRNHARTASRSGTRCLDGSVTGPIVPVNLLFVRAHADGRMRVMPGTNLTRDEAATRAALLDVTSYSIDLDLTTGDTTFGSTTTIRFTCREPGA